ncbi:MAG: GNAT family N-acetyltransferase [Planctomycetota bacterium]|jgi:ribosomal protein S18 acetylase RimI-like enzyme
MRLCLNERPEVRALCDLRESVGWGGNANDYPRAFESYRLTAAAYEGDRLVGWCASVGDGVRHLFLIDLIVHPEFQRRGIGRALVEHIVAEADVELIHADFTPEHAAFYARCGFRIGKAGILARPSQ